MSFRNRVERLSELVADILEGALYRTRATGDRLEIGPALGLPDSYSQVRWLAENPNVIEQPSLYGSANPANRPILILSTGRQTKTAGAGGGETLRALLSLQGESRNGVDPASATLTAGEVLIQGPSGVHTSLHLIGTIEIDGIVTTNDLLLTNGLVSINAGIESAGSGAAINEWDHGEVSGGAVTGTVGGVTSSVSVAHNLNAVPKWVGINGMTGNRNYRAAKANADASVFVVKVVQASDGSDLALGTSVAFEWFAFA